MKKRYCGNALIASALFIMFVSCSRKPVLVGYCAALTGSNSDLGISGRNGAMLAEASVNSAGGIQGRQLRLIFGDDKNDETEALKADKALMDAGARIIVGHITGDTSKAVLPLMEKTGTLLISPTASADELTMKDDMLIMLNTSNKAPAFVLGTYAAAQLGLTKAGILCTTENASYAESYLRGFSEGFSASGEALMDIVYYSQKDADFSYGRSIHQLRVVNPDCILIIDSPLNTALFCQNLRKADYRAPVFVCGWAVTEELIKNVGESTEGAYFSQQFNPELMTPDFVAFSDEYGRRFTAEPTFASVFSYEAVLMAAEALAEKGNMSPKTYILTKKHFRGLQETISVDTFGDVSRKAHIGTIRDGAFQFFQD